MRNQYNILAASGLTSFFSCLSLWLALLGRKAEALANFKDIFTTVAGLSLLVLALSVVLMFVVFAFWLTKGFGIWNLWRSLWATFVIREYCRKVTNEHLILEGGTKVSTTNKVSKRANRSLYTLNVIMTKDTAQLTWYLPFNHESKENLLVLFPNIKTELNQLAPAYVFNDITNIKGNFYQATAYKL